MLQTWRVGSDVADTVVRLVEREMRDMGVEGYGRDSGNGKTGDGGGERKVKDIK